LHLGDENRKVNDFWFQFSGAVDEFNEICKNMCMEALQNCIGRTSTILSRKPKPIGKKRVNLLSFYY
jgi:hypothetical protein